MSTTVVETNPASERGISDMELLGETREAAKASPQWGLVKRIVFRYVFAYFVIDLFPFPLDAIPYGDALGKSYADLWHAAVPWVGRHVFQLEITVLPNGSGDTTYNYVEVLCYLTMAAAATAVWTLLDRSRSSYPALLRGLRIYVRFALAAVMFTYGSVKVIKSQFPDPTLDRLVQPFGDASPMGLLWTFMGASESYNVFTGAGELLGGLLLTTRRTTLLGALVCFAVLSQVVMLNFSYDVPVKLFSCQLLAMSLFLIAPDLGRLMNMFLLNRRVAPVELYSLSRKRWVELVAKLVRSALVVWFLGRGLLAAHEVRKTFGDLAPKSPLYGIWNVDEFEADGKARLPLVTDAERWRRVIFDNPKMLAIQLMSDSRNRYMLNQDASARTLALSKRDDPAWKTSFSYRQLDSEHLEMEGKLDGKTIRAKLHRTDSRSFLLISRGFHWINEYPFNR
jgi:hypothetical protein